MSCQGQNLPTIFVKREYDHKVIGNFMKKKYLALSQFIGKPETTHLFYSMADFEDLLGAIKINPLATGVRIYFASYCITQNGDINRLTLSGYQDMMTLIFVGTQTIGEKQTDLGPWYIISPNGGLITMDFDTASKLFMHYKKCKVPLLQQIVGDFTDTFTETLSLWVSYKSLDGKYGFLQEAKCQDAEGISAFLGTYGEDEDTTGLPGEDPNIDWQMTIIFQLSKTVTYKNRKFIYHFDIENTPGFKDRKPPPVEDDGGFKGGNTLSPCPPATNCGLLCTDCDGHP